ncbi:HAD-IIB family hydrolase [Citreimonas salinaria]|uniref:HAD-superfamily hydrolase, subfamily IIB n=1 Tax=Citreimonas salinaria TaxID=321339 RepID=A0A1H3F3E9_9RHOB|nr:HAD-IIB family hydrolase [Citreimonas salinaria]SDX85377.1 HAD-superfamily hydrolase, subfamily IIB [Citreimonas salinaria]
MKHKTVDISEKPLVLATALDGTFLGGTDEARRKYYDWINANRHAVGLIFVTGRDPGFVSELSRRKGVPKPDYVVGDVGTTIAFSDDRHILNPIAELEAEIVEKWDDSSARVQAALRSIPGLRLQGTAFRQRVSYDMDPDKFDRRAVDIIEDMGLDALISDNKFFDVLPKGVSKGPSLLRLLAHLGVKNDRVLVAGDTMNDHSMLTMGLPSVVVAGAEPALLEAVEKLDTVHVAKEEGVGGIAEATLRNNYFNKCAA